MISRNINIQKTCQNFWDGVLDELRRAIKSGVDVNTAVSGSTPLIEATSLGQVEALKILLKQGADVNLTNITGQSVLDVTEDSSLHKLLGKTSNKDKANYDTIRKILIKAGADNRKKHGPKMSIEQEKQFFYSYAAQGNISKVKELLVQRS